jgi:tetratricopeptide (TPR) repeat protein
MIILIISQLFLSSFNVMNNSFTNLRGHGYLGTKTYRTPDTEPDYHGFSNNWFQNNGGCELIGDGPSLSSIKMLIDYPNNLIIDQQGSTVNEPSSVFDFENWDHYLLANLTPEDIAEVYNNTIIPDWVAAPDRFYPDVSAFVFVPEPPEPPTSPQSLMNTGTEYFFQGEFSMAEDIMKQIVEAYPDSSITASAISYLYLIERATENDYAALREYLDLKIPFENMAPYLEKEAIKTQCYLKEEDYLSAIQRLQLVINNPISVADSLFALIDQSYCLYKYASEGSKSLPKCNATTTSLESYMDFLTKIGKPQHSIIQEATCPNPSKLLIQSNYPNPFNPSTIIDYTVPQDGCVKLIVYNLRGQKVKELVNGEHLAGNHKIIWTGTDTSGQLVSSGIYFIRVEQGGKSHVRKMMLLK